MPVQCGLSDILRARRTVVLQSTSYLLFDTVTDGATLAIQQNSMTSVSSYLSPASHNARITLEYVTAYPRQVATLQRPGAILGYPLCMSP